MNELSLLRDYVTTMERQLQSKNNQLQTLRNQNQKLIRQNQQLSMRKTLVYNTNNLCMDCNKHKADISDLQRINTQLQNKYENLQKNKQNSLSRSSVRIISSTPVTSIQSSICNDCSRLKMELKSKEETIISLRSQLRHLSSRITSFESQIDSLTTTNSTPAYIQQSPVTDSSRRLYLNNQIQQYLALINSLRSEIKSLSQQNNRYINRIHQLQSHHQIKYIQKELSPQLKQQMQILKQQVMQLNNMNSVLQHQNHQLHQEIRLLPRDKIVWDSNIYQQPVRSYDHFTQDTRSKHYKRNNAPQSFQKVKYDEIQRKIQFIQGQNQQLRNNFYTRI